MEALGTAGAARCALRRRRAPACTGVPLLPCVLRPCKVVLAATTTQQNTTVDPERATAGIHPRLKVTLSGLLAAALAPLHTPSGLWDPSKGSRTVLGCPSCTLCHCRQRRRCCRLRRRCCRLPADPHPHPHPSPAACLQLCHCCTACRASMSRPRPQLAARQPGDDDAMAAAREAYAASFAEAVARARAAGEGSQTIRLAIPEELACLVPPLCDAAREGDSREVARLIAAGADVDATDLSGASPLRVAASRGRAGVCRQLLDAGAAVGCADAGVSQPAGAHWRCEDAASCRSRHRLAGCSWQHRAAFGGAEWVCRRGCRACGSGCRRQRTMWAGRDATSAAHQCEPPVRPTTATGAAWR